MKTIPCPVCKATGSKDGRRCVACGGDKVVEAGGSWDPEQRPLTRREQFAMAAMQGYSARHGSEGIPNWAAQYAVDCADALIAALEAADKEGG